MQVQELVAQLEEARGKSERLVEARRAAEERARALELRLQYLLNRSRDDERKAVTTHATTQQLEEQVRRRRRCCYRRGVCLCCFSAAVAAAASDPCGSWLPHARPLRAQIKALQAELADTRKRLRAVGASNAAMAAAMRATETTLEASAAPRLPTPAARSTLPASRAGGGSRRGSNGSDDADPSRDGPTRALSRSTGALSRPQSVPAARNRQRTASTASGARGGGGAADEAGGGGEFPDHDPALGGNPLGNSIAGLPLPHSDSEDDAEIGGRTFEPGAQRKPFKVVVQPPTRLGATVGPIVIKARDPVANTFLLRYAVNTWLRNFARGDASRQARRLKAETAQQLATLLTIAHEAEAGLRGAHADHEREVAQLQTKLLYLQVLPLPLSLCRCRYRCRCRYCRPRCRHSHALPAPPSAPSSASPTRGARCCCAWCAARWRSWWRSCSCSVHACRGPAGRWHSRRAAASTCAAAGCRMRTCTPWWH